MTRMARERENALQGYDAIQVLKIGTTQAIAGVGTGALFLTWGVGATAAAAETAATSGSRLHIAANTSQAFAVTPGQFVAAYDGSAAASAANAMGANTTAVQVYYDSVAGTAFVCEGG